MIALALLFMFIICLLWVIARLFQKYFDTYDCLYGNESNYYRESQKLYFQAEQKRASVEEINNEINALINERLIEVEQKFSALEYDNNLSAQNPEIVINTLKHVLISYLNLLKVGSHNHEH